MKVNEFGDGTSWEDHIKEVFVNKEVFYQSESKFVGVIKRNLLSVKHRPRLLDCGCHVGRYIEMFQKAGFDYIGVDQSEKVIEIAKRYHPNDKFIASFLWDIHFDKEFDVAVCVAVLQHNVLEEKKKILPKICKALKSGGIFFMAESTILKETKTQLTYKGWISLVESFGFRFIESFHKNDDGFEDKYIFRKE